MLSCLLQIVSVGCICGIVFVRVRPRPVFLKPLWVMSLPDCLWASSLTLKRPGGGLNQPPPSTFCATIPPRKFFWPRCSLTFYFQVSRILWHHFRENRAYHYDAARPFIHARQTENGSKTWFCVQSQCKWSFLILFIKIWLFSLSLAEINSF